MSYDTDFYRWTQQQAAALRRAGRERVNAPDTVDWENVAEEIESMGRSDRREIASRLEVILHHLLKLAFSPDPHPRRGWMETVLEQRSRLLEVLELSPSLRSAPAEMLETVYRRALRLARLDPGIGNLPAVCPFELDGQILDEDWMPPAPDDHS